VHLERIIKDNLDLAMGMEKRHYYMCGGETLSWQSPWYTQPWFTDYRQSYDRAASTGPVGPPLEVYQTAPACSKLLQSQDSRLSEVFATQTGGVVTTQTITGSRVSRGEVYPTIRTTVYTLPPTTAPSASMPTTALPTSSAVTSTTRAGAQPTTTLLAVGSINTCAGDWDWQAWGVTASLGIGLIIGSLIWLLWAILRGKFPAIFSARSWFVPQE
jgi:hypothetical protein